MYININSVHTLYSYKIISGVLKNKTSYYFIFFTDRSYLRITEEKFVILPFDVSE